MNRKSLENALTNSPVSTVKVSNELHQDIMRAVRQVEPAGRKTVFSPVKPAWAVAAVAATVTAVVFYLPRTETVAPALESSPAQSQVQALDVSLLNLEESLIALSGESPMPEQELRKELERLKSDLARFDLRS